MLRSQSGRISLVAARTRGAATRMCTAAAIPAAARYLLGASLEPALAMQLADRSIQLKEEWNNVWTKAQLLHAAGKNSEALAAAQHGDEVGGARILTSARRQRP